MELYLSSLRREYSVNSFEIINDTARLPMHSFTQESERAKFLQLDANSSHSLDSIDGELTRKMNRFSIRGPSKRGRCRWSDGVGNEENVHPRRFSVPEVKNDRSPTPPIRR